MKPIICLLLLLTACNASRDVLSPHWRPSFSWVSEEALCQDPGDSCWWSVRTSNYLQWDTSFSSSECPRCDSINIFVKEGNELKWYSRAGLQTWLLTLTSHNLAAGWYEYVILANYPKYRYLVWWPKTGTITFFDKDFNTEIKFTK